MQDNVVFYMCSIVEPLNVDTGRLFYTEHFVWSQRSINMYYFTRTLSISPNGVHISRFHCIHNLGEFKKVWWIRTSTVDVMLSMDVYNCQLVEH